MTKRCHSVYTGWGCDARKAIDTLIGGGIILIEGRSPHANPPSIEACFQHSATTWKRMARMLGSDMPDRSIFYVIALVNA